MNTKLRLQLSAMMFINYFVWGCWFVTIFTYMVTQTEEGGLGFSGTQAAFAFGNYAFAAMVSPFFIGMVADRFFATEKVMAVLHFLGAIFMFGLTQVTDYNSFFILLLAYNLCFMPTIALTNSLSFHHLDDPEKQFPGIRVLGTIAWIVIGFIIGGLGTTVLPLQIAVAISILMGIYSLTLPHTPPKGKSEKAGIREILGLDALALLKDRSYATVVIASMLLCIPLGFYFSLSNTFLTEIGTASVGWNLFDINFAESERLLILGQVSEIFFLISLPFFFKRWGMKWVMVVGMAAWAIRYVFFGFGDTDSLIWMIIFGIVLHGICYDFFFVSGQIFVDKNTPETLKSSAQGLITFATYGVGLYIGTILSGFVVDAFLESGGGHDWKSIWLIPAGLAAVVLVGFMALFNDKETEEEKEMKTA